MDGRYKKWVKGLSLFLFFLAVAAAIYIPDERWKAGFALLAGAIASFLASVLVQEAAAAEQTALLRQLGLKVDGIRPLPDEFRKIRWIAHSTTSPGKEHAQYEWRIREVEKQTDVGDSFSVYNSPSRNLVSQDANYKCVFLGLSGRVAAIISLGDEPTSVLIFDAPVTSAGVYFGPGYIIDWHAKRSVTLAIVGLGDVPCEAGQSSSHGVPIRPKWTKEIVAAFNAWYRDIDWDIEDVAREFERYQEVTETTGGKST